MEVSSLDQGCTVGEGTPGLRVEIPDHTTSAMPVALFSTCLSLPSPNRYIPTAALPVPSWTYHTFQTACPVLIRKPFYHLIRLRFLGGQTQIRLRVAARSAVVRGRDAFADCGHKPGHIPGLDCPK